MRAASEVEWHEGRQKWVDEALAALARLEACETQRDALADALRRIKERDTRHQSILLQRGISISYEPRYGPCALIARTALAEAAPLEEQA